MNKKILLVSGLIVLLGGFFVYEKFGTAQNSQTPIINNDQQTSGNNNPPQNQPTTGFKDGSYTGAETSSNYGNAQVKVIISSGKITDVVYLTYPKDRAVTVMKSNLAMPAIKQEVIQAQSVNVNTISGATQTSEAFLQSIASALSQAS